MASSAEELRDGWEVAGTVPGAAGGPGDLDALEWLPARVPGTVAAALAGAVPDRLGAAGDLDASDWWFRTRFRARPAEPGELAELVLDGLATVAEVYLNGELVLASTSMFLPHRVDVRGHLREQNVLTLGFRALAPLLEQSRRPRARWRTRVAHPNLRFFRTSLLGRAPGFAPGPAPVGPWRPVRLERRRRAGPEAVALLPSLDGDDGVLAIRALLRPAPADPGALRVDAELDGPSGRHRAALELTPDGDGLLATGTVRVPGVERWWPHTHGTPALHDVRLRIADAGGERTVPAGRTGFRSFAAGSRPGHDVEADGLDPHVNGRRVFARGAVWTPADPIALAAGDAELRAQLERVRDAGMNLVRVPGIGAYEDDRFHALCDELGLMVWQDLMFANFDYPDGDAGFRAEVEAEVRAALGRIAGRPSTVIVCGGSEVEQQATMFGVDPAIARSELFARRLPELVAEADPALCWVPSAPSGGDLPFRPGRGVANYFGVGAYGLPLEDARRAGVRFASECLAFANVPDEHGVDAVAPGAPADVLLADPRWTAGVPRDVGADWDFEDVRDRYLGLLFGEDPAELRRVDPDRYLELSRATSGEVMAVVMGEWRRAASPCG
ncbi:MAG: beta-mannosidase, partial [Solirubrobacteraceae bacterium]|nr:beta-mannosidase [Solirubrobacteraceae bacterium]